MNRAYLVYGAWNDYEIQERWAVGMVFDESLAREMVKQLKEESKRKDGRTEYFGYEEVPIFGCDEQFDVKNYEEISL